MTVHLDTKNETDPRNLDTEICERYPKVSSRRSLRVSLSGQLVSRTRPRGQLGCPVCTFCCVGVISCASAGATRWSGTRTTGVSGLAHCSSVLLSSISNEDCSWIFSSETERGERDEMKGMKKIRHLIRCGLICTWKQHSDGVMDCLS